MRSLQEAIRPEAPERPVLGDDLCNYVVKADFMGSMHGPIQCMYELWTGKHPDLIKLPMAPLRSVVMAHIPLDQQTVETDRSVLDYEVSTSLGNMGGLCLLNPKTMRDVIRRAYKVLGHKPQPSTQPENEITEDGDVIVASMFLDTVGTLHHNSDDMELYMTVPVVVEEFDEEVRCVSRTGALVAMTVDDEYLIQIQNIVKDIAEYAIDQPARVSKKAAKKVALQHEAASRPYRQR